jgi:hypothetical protein
MKKQLLTAVAICIGALSFTTEAHAGDDRLSLYEVKAFMANFNSDINSPDMNSGRRFLNMSVANRATFQDTIFHDWNSDHAKAYVVSDNNGGFSAYRYRYPYQANAYNRTSAYTMTKSDIVHRFEMKKRTIPGYSHSVDVLGINMNAAANQAVADIVIREFGASYTPQAPNYIGQHKVSESRCKASVVTGRRGNLILTGMNCNTTGQYPL